MVNNFQSWVANLEPRICEFATVRQVEDVQPASYVTSPLIQHE